MEIFPDPRNLSESMQNGRCLRRKDVMEEKEDGEAKKRHLEDSDNEEGASSKKVTSPRGQRTYTHPRDKDQ